MRKAEATRRGGVRLRAKGYRFEEVRVLDGISFDVGRGELFGIIGRNGSGKSTLLKILARIYECDSGSVAIAGRLAPFVHLGVGFHPELTAWDNVCTNAVMMGLTSDQARERFETILEFAELEQFRGLELKNYSSGMRMRLAFSTLLQVEADVFLIDEILSVGDARFREKSAEAFASLRQQGKTIVIVSHSLADIRHCDRALALQEGKIGLIGDPEEVTSHYLELQKTRKPARGGPQAPANATSDDQATEVEIADLWLEDSAGRVASRVPKDEELRIHAVVESARPVRDPLLVCEICDVDGTLVRALDPRPLGGPERRLRPGDRIHAEFVVGPELTPGNYIASCQLMRVGKAGRGVQVTPPSVLHFGVSRAGRTLPAQSAGTPRRGLIESDAQG